MREAAYVGENLDLGDGRVVLEPRTLAKMLDALDIGPDDMVLDVAASYGYSSAVIARMAETVVALEEDEAMAREAQDALSANGFDNAVVETGAMAAGAPEHAPFDVIIVQGGVEDMPLILTDQLKEGGRIATLFIKDALGEVRIGHKMNGRIVWRQAFNAGAPVLPGFERRQEFAL